MDWLTQVKFDKDGLIPAIAQDHTTGRILMMAWMNAESLQLTAEKKQAVYFSRSRNRLWHKGESSGHIQHVHDIRLDCDADVIVLSVTQLGGIACHTGRESCFFRLLTDEKGELTWQITDNVLKAPEAIYGKPAENTSQTLLKSNEGIAKQESPQQILSSLDTLLAERKHASPDSSYVASLYHKGINKILEKVGEETTEAILAAKDFDNTKSDTHKNELIYEIADVWFHTMVTLAWFNIPSSQVTHELARRFGISGIDEKNSRQMSP